MEAMTTRRALLGTATAAAIVGFAATAAGHARQTASPDLLTLVAAARQANDAADAYHRDVYDPADMRRTAAVAAAKATLPHTTVDAGQTLSGERIVWTTANPANVTLARFQVDAAKGGANLAPKHVAAARTLLAAHLRRERAVAGARKMGNIGALAKQSDALCDKRASAEHAVAAFPASTPADLALKLSFMVERSMGDGMDWLPELLADAQRITGEIA